ncbi:hypothetical protein O2W15_03165 [Modestobacter sp. VKM Ac-2979]|uniref:hypothetical protein n=1 Tax=unclassified Modestobacter TaxID=2643866 RepID=UPI0022AB87C4|nr:MULTISPECIES: hypothetical protein [unclassified Modestobacter]MCZ2810428.1 hypothetical protein [Modestobacter sp. VKM Ac-2979]MCZ2841914.1 hypothetical protein [Modestobacter sp. VKM Ac-2980]
MISPFRWDVVVTGFVLAIPVFLLGLRGDFTVDDVTTRLLWCLGAGWVAVGLLRWASTPPPPARHARPSPAPADEPAPS